MILDGGMPAMMILGSGVHAMMILGVYAGFMVAAPRLAIA